MRTRYALEAQYETAQGVQSAEATIEAPDPDEACWALTARIQEQTGADLYAITIRTCRPIPLEAA